MSELSDHLRSKVDKSLRKITVPEWGDDEPMVLYARPFTCIELERLQKDHPAVLMNRDPRANVAAIILKALKPDGTKAFDLEDEEIMLRMDPDLIARVARELLVGGVPTTEELKKN